MVNKLFRYQQIAIVDFPGTTDLHVYSNFSYEVLGALHHYNAPYIRKNVLLSNTDSTKSQIQRLESAEQILNVAKQMPFSSLG